jgi:aminomethyltransferase
MVELDQDQDFIGREALREISHQGVRRRLVGVEIGGNRLGAYNDGSMPDFFPVIQDNGERIGKVTSACYSPRLDKNIGYAMVPVEHGELGTELAVERPDGTVAAVVADRVFIKPEKAEQHLPAPGSSEGG